MLRHPLFQLQQVVVLNLRLRLRGTQRRSRMWPLDDLDVDNEVRLVWIPTESPLQHTGGVRQHLPKAKVALLHLPPPGIGWGPGAQHVHGAREAWLQGLV